MDLADIRRLIEAQAQIGRVPAVRWEGGIGHPRQLLGGIRAWFEDAGFTVESALEDRQGPIRDVSYFEGAVLAKRDTERTDWALALLGLLLTPALIGIPMVRAASQRRRLLVSVTAEGETYWVGAKGLEGRAGPGAEAPTVAERSGVVGDTRVALRAAAGPPLKQTEFQLARRSRTEAQDVAETLESVARYIEARWPALAGEAVAPPPGPASAPGRSDETAIQRRPR